MSERPTISNADEWALWLVEGPLAGDGGIQINAEYLAVQIVEAIEEHQRALAREVYGLAEDTAAQCEGVAKLDLEGKQGAFARGRIMEAKGIARAINAIMPYSRDPMALAHGGRQRLAGRLYPTEPPLRKRPVAWMRGVTTPSSPHGPAEHDVEFVYGDDEPEGEGWIALYRRNVLTRPELAEICCDTPDGKCNSPYLCSHGNRCLNPRAALPDARMADRNKLLQHLADTATDDDVIVP